MVEAAVNTRATAAAPGAPACQVCGADDAATLVTQHGFAWLRCPDCGFAFLAEMPSADAASAIQDDAMGARYIAGYQTKLDSKMRRSRRRVARLARRMPGPRLLDVGANIGCLVAAGAERGLDAVGLEINPALVAHAQKTYPAGRFVCGTIEDNDFADASFDGVYCSEVIEHVPDNNSFVAGIARVTAPGGVLFLTTPGLHEYVRGGDPGAWRDFGAPDHKLYHTRDSMRRLLARHGFDRVHFVYSFGKGLKLFARRAG
jgi:SAM-dependent methyltransferase